MRLRMRIRRRALLRFDVALENASNAGCVRRPKANASPITAKGKRLQAPSTGQGDRGSGRERGHGYGRNALHLKASCATRRKKECGAFCVATPRIDVGGHGGTEAASGESAQAVGVRGAPTVWIPRRRVSHAPNIGGPAVFEEPAHLHALSIHRMRAESGLPALPTRRGPAVAHGGERALPATGKSSPPRKRLVWPPVGGATLLGETMPAITTSSTECAHLDKEHACALDTTRNATSDGHGRPRSLASRRASRESRATWHRASPMLVRALRVSR